MSNAYRPGCQAVDENFNIEDNCLKLSNGGIPQSSINEFRIRWIFLKEAVAKGYNIFKIGAMVTSPETEKCTPCLLDSICNNTRNMLNFGAIDFELIKAEIIKKLERK